LAALSVHLIEQVLGAHEHAAISILERLEPQRGRKPGLSDISGATLFCPWHGKVKIEQMRMHFTFPIQRDMPLYIAYIGPKLTKR
jgi:hypothetical protein